MKSLSSWFKKVPRVPDKGQRVRLLTEKGKWLGGYRAVSYPVTSEDGEGAIWVAVEAEFWLAQWEDRLAKAELWPVRRVKVPKSRRRRA